MHHPHAPTKTSLFKIALCAVAAAVLLGLVPSSAGAAVPAIERYPTYRPQTTCSPKPKPGTVMLARHLMRRYKGSGSLGISRPCRSGGVSEHKEGRAFDWALSAGSRRGRHHARHFLHRLREPDRLGRRGALARRMGVMYAIWDDHIYSATYHYKKRRYLNASCRSIRRCSVTLRHRDHMHISLTRAAAHKKTSWYSKHRAGPKKHKSKHKPKRKVKPKKRHHGKAKADKPRRHHKARGKADKRRQKARDHKQAHHHKARPHRARHHKHARHHQKARHHKHARHHKARPHRARHHKHARHHQKARHHKKARHHRKARRHKARNHEKARHNRKARPHRSKVRHHKHARHHKARPQRARHHKHARHHQRRHHRRR